MKSLKSLLNAKKQNLDQRSLALIERAEKSGEVKGKALELLVSIRDQFEVRGFLTEGQRALIRKVLKEAEERKLHVQAAKKLADMYNAGEVRPESMGFVESVIDFVNRVGYLTPLQFEQVAHLVAESKTDVIVKEEGEDKDEDDPESYKGD